MDYSACNRETKREAKHRHCPSRPCVERSCVLPSSQAGCCQNSGFSVPQNSFCQCNCPCPSHLPIYRVSAPKSRLTIPTLRLEARTRDQSRRWDEGTYWTVKAMGCVVVRTPRQLRFSGRYPSNVGMFVPHAVWFRKRQHVGWLQAWQFPGFPLHHGQHSSHFVFSIARIGFTGPPNIPTRSE